MKKIKIVSVFIIIIVSLHSFMTSCTKEMDKQNWVLSIKSINSFKFTKNNNATYLTSDIAGVVSESYKKITFLVPLGTNVTDLRPTIMVDNSSTVSPKSYAPQDFTSPVKYTVTAEDKTSVYYMVNVYQSFISAFKFQGVSGTTSTIKGNVFTVTVPKNTDITSLTPDLTLYPGAGMVSYSEDMTVSYDFSTDFSFSVTSADESNTTPYIVKVIKKS